MKGLLIIFVVVIAILGLCIIGLCFNIIFRKDGKFPETEISSNKEMRKLGIRCAKEEEMRLWEKNGQTPSCSEEECSACSGCDFLKRPEKD